MYASQTEPPEKLKPLIEILNNLLNINKTLHSKRLCIQRDLSIDKEDMMLSCEISNNHRCIHQRLVILDAIEVIQGGYIVAIQDY